MGKAPSGSALKATAMFAGGCAAAAAVGDAAGEGDGDGEGEGDGDGDGDGDGAAGVMCCATVGVTRDAWVELGWPHAASTTIAMRAVSLAM